MSFAGRVGRRCTAVRTRRGCVCLATVTCTVRTRWRSGTRARCCVTPATRAPRACGVPRATPRFARAVIWRSMTVLCWAPAWACTNATASTTSLAALPPRSLLLFGRARTATPRSTSEPSWAPTLLARAPLPLSRYHHHPPMQIEPSQTIEY